MSVRVKGGSCLPPTHGLLAPSLPDQALAIETNCNWAVPGSYTAPEKHNQFACYEDGSNCKPKAR